MIEDTIIDLNAYSLGIEEGISRVIDGFVYMGITIICIDLGAYVEVSPKHITN